MTAHVALPCLTPGDTVPATLSPAIMSGMLRDSLGFGGVVVTDALSMGAIVTKYGPGEAAVRAFLGGSDLLLDPTDVRGTYRAMVAAVESGRIARERLDASVRRVLELKQRAGLFERRTVSLDSIPGMVGRREFQGVADDVAARSLTLVQRGTLETMRASRSRTAVILYAEETNLNIGNTLIREMRWAGDTVTPFRLFPASGGLSYDSARAIIARNPRVVFATSVRFIAGRGHVSMPDSLAQLVLATQRQKPVLLASFGSPYLLSQLPGYQGAYLLAWSNAPSTERAVARALSWGAPVTGRLPITLNQQYRRGHGITLARSGRATERSNQD
jgi:beta-N-acetylhexosaminidase